MPRRVGTQRIQRGDLFGGAHPRAAATLDLTGLGARADDSDPGTRRERQDAPVGEQHQAPDRRSMGDLGGVDVVDVDSHVGGGRGAFDEPDDIGGRARQLPIGELAGVDRLQGVATAPTRRPGHLEIETALAAPRPSTVSRPSRR